MITPNLGEPTRAEMQDHIYDLEKQHQVDEEMIAYLQAEGAIDRDKLDHLELALKSARCIGAAIGILMERHKITDQEAFDRLATTSRREQLKLRDVAERLVLTGEWPHLGSA